MNIYAAVKKSFFSKLFSFAMAAFISLNALIPTVASAAITFTPASGTPPPGWLALPVEAPVVVDNSGFFDPLNYQVDKMSFLRSPGQHGYYDKNFAGDGLQQGYVATQMARILNQAHNDTYDPERIFVIGTVGNDGKNVSNYYFRQSNGTTILVATARDSGLYVAPPGGVSKLGALGTDEVNASNLGTEAGINNYFDRQEGRSPGNSTNTSIRGSDTGNAFALEQERKNLQSQIEELNKRIASSTNPTEKAQLEAQKAELERQLELNRQTRESVATTNNSEINTESCKAHWYSIATIGCMTAVVAVLANMYLKLVSWLLGMVGMLFDYSIEIAVNSAEFIDKIGVVEPIWSFIRDLLNMTFIFILLWIAANIILGKKNYSLRSNVVRVVIVAVLINFSLFASKLMVDASNLLTLQIYQAAKGGSVLSTTPTISAKIMDTLGMPTLYGFGDIMSNKTIQGCGNANGTIITIAIFGSIFMIILGLAFLFGAVLFFSRMANIIYLFITSPLWVWGYIMKTEIFDTARKGWEAKMKQVVKFPVVYMLFIFVGMFAFVKLIGLRSNQNLSFLTLFCIAEDKSLIGQLPLVMNFCLVIWVMLKAIQYGVKEGAGPAGSSLGFTRKFNESVSKKFGKWAENTWRRPLDYSVGKTKQLAGGLAAGAKAGTRYVGNKGSNLVAKGASRVAQSADTPTLLRNLAGKLAGATKDRKFFGKTQKEAEEAWKKKVVGNTAANTNRTLNAALDSVGDAPKFDPESDDGEADMKKRVAEYAEKTAGVFIKSGILNDNGNRDKIIQAALAGIKEETNADGTKSYKFNQAMMRQKIDDVRRDHMPGNDKGNRSHINSNILLSPYDKIMHARQMAREKAITARTSSMVSSDGKAQGKKDDSPEALREEVKKHEEELKKYPVTRDQLEVWIKDNPDALKGIGSAKKIAEQLKDIEVKEAKIKELDAVQADFDEWGSVDKDHVQIAKLKGEVEKTKNAVEKAKKSIMDQRGKIQQSINAKNKKIEGVGKK